MKFMSDKFKKHLPPSSPGDNGKIRLDPRESDGTFNNAGPKQSPITPPQKPINQGQMQPTNPKPPGTGFAKPGLPSKRTPITAPPTPRGTIRLDPRERNGFQPGQPKGMNAKPKPGAHREFMNRAKEQGISEKEITRFIARKMKPGSRK